MTRKNKDTHPPDSGKRPDRRWWIVGLGVALILLLAAYAARRHFLSAAYLERQIVTAVRASTDSLYRVELGTVDVSLLQRTLQVTDVVIAPDTSVFGPGGEAGARPSVGYTVTAASVRMAGINLWALLWQGAVKVRALQIRRPHVHLALAAEAVAAADSAAAPGEDESLPAADETRSLHRDLARALPFVEIGQVRIDSAEVSWSSATSPTRTHEAVDGIFATLDYVIIDSAAVQDTSRVLFSEDVQIRIEGFRRAFSDSLYLLNVGSIRGSSKDACLTLDSLRWEPTVSDEAFMRRHTYQTDRYRAGFHTLTLQGIDYWGLLEKGRIFMASAVVAAPLVDVYHDRTLPLPPDLPPATLPHTSFQAVDQPLRLDTLRVQGGAIRYHERAEDGARPGTIRFEDVWGTVYNVTNTPDRMTPATPVVIDGRALLLGTGRLEAHIEYELLSPGLTMRYRGTLGGMEAEAFNEVFVDLEGVRITQGHVDSVWFDLTVNQDGASGPFQMLYRDLKIDLLDKVTHRRNLGKRLATIVANNLVLNADNLPQDDTPAKVAVVHAERSPDMPLFKFLWVTIREGLFSTLGL